MVPIPNNVSSGCTDENLLVIVPCLADEPEHCNVKLDETAPERHLRFRLRCEIQRFDDRAACHDVRRHLQAFDDGLKCFFVVQ